MLPLSFPACKFLQLPVQVLVGSLTRPVTADHTHDHTGHSEEQHNQHSGLHSIQVPCQLASTRLIAIAEMNMPAMIQTMSMLPHVYAEIDADRDHQYPECQVGSHSNIYAVNAPLYLVVLVHR